MLCSASCFHEASRSLVYDRHQGTELEYGAVNTAAAGHLRDEAVKLDFLCAWKVSFGKLEWIRGSKETIRAAQLICNESEY